MVATEERLLESHTIDRRRAWSRRLAIAWAVTVTALIALEPAPTNPDAPEPLWATVAAFSFLAALGAMAVGFTRQRRWAFVVSGGAGVLGMFLAWACLATGHHLGAWWMIELGAFAALTAFSITAAERTAS